MIYFLARHRIFHATLPKGTKVTQFQENLDPLCTFDCDNFEFNSVETTLPTDRRYWLLTVVGGFFGPQDYPMLEDKLAKLYRVAFTRQQARHLGINTNVTNSSTSIERIKRDIQPTRVQIDPTNPTSLAKNGIHLNKFVHAYERSVAQRRQRLKKVLKRDLYEVTTNSSLTFDNVGVNDDQNSQLNTNRNNSISIGGGVGANNSRTSNNNGGDKENKRKGRVDYQQIILEQRNRRNRQKVTVMIHNLTHLTDDDIAKSINQGDNDLPDAIKR